MFQPRADAQPSMTAPRVMVDATDRSMPAVAITNVCPTARTTRIAAATSIASTLPTVRNAGVAMKKTMDNATRPTPAAQSAKKPTSRSRAVSGSVSLTPTAVFVSDMMLLCCRRPGTGSTRSPGAVRSSAGQRLEGVVEGAERLGEAADGLVGDVLGDQQHRGLDVGGELLAGRGGLARLHAHLPDRVRVLRDRGRQLTLADGLEGVLDPVHADDLDLAGLAGVLDRPDDAEPHVVVGGEEALEPGLGAQDVGGRGQRLLAVPVGGDRLHDVELAGHGLLEAVEPGAAGHVAGDAADERDLAAAGELLEHLLPRHLAGVD